MGRRFRDFMANFRRAEQIAEESAETETEEDPTIQDELYRSQSADSENLSAAERARRIDRMRFQEGMRSLLAEPGIMPHPTSTGNREILEHDILNSPIDEIEERYSFLYDAPSEEIWSNTVDRERLVRLLKKHPRYAELMQAPQVQEVTGGVTLDDMVQRGSSPREMFRVLQAMENARQTIPPASPTPSSQPEAAVVPGQSGLPGDIPTELNPVMAGVMERRGNQTDPVSGRNLGELSP